MTPDEDKIEEFRARCRQIALVLLEAGKTFISAATNPDVEKARAEAKVAFFAVFALTEPDAPSPPFEQTGVE